MFRRKKPTSGYEEFDKTVWKPVLKCSICNGEQVAAFCNRETGETKEVALIQSPRELQEFLDFYGLEEIEKVY